MRKFLLSLCFLLFNIVAFGQSAKEMLEEIKGKWELDDNNNVTFVKIIEAPGLSKDEIYNRAFNFFTYNYVSGKSVIQNQDKEAGLLVGKGFYDDVHIGISILTTHIDAYHILRVDAKDGKARAIVTLTEYEKKTTGTAAYTLPVHSTTKISEEYPINEKGGQKTIMSKAFYKSYKKAMSTLERVEKAIKEGSTSKALENSDW